MLGSINLFLYIKIYGITIIFLKFPTAIFLVTRPYMVSRTKLYRLTLRLSNSWQQRVRMEKLAANDLTYRVFLPPPCCDRRNCSYNEQFNASVTPYNVVQFPVPVYIRLNKTEPRRYKWTLNWSSYLNLHFYLFCIYAH